MTSIIQRVSTRSFTIAELVVIDDAAGAKLRMSIFLSKQLLQDNRPKTWNPIVYWASELCKKY